MRQTINMRVYQGAEPPDADEVPLSRRLRELRVQNMLEKSPEVCGCRGLLEGKWKRGTRGTRKIAIRKILNFHLFYPRKEQDMLLKPLLFQDKYDKSAVKVSQDKEAGGGGAGERFRRGVSLTPSKLPVSKRSLVYIQPSPDYCSDDPQVRQSCLVTIGNRVKIWKIR